MQHNKRDLPHIVPVEELNGLLNSRGVPWFPASATSGEGVFDTLKDIAKQVILELKRKG